ncbi:MAG: hypothetical protein R3C14_54430 [Caldilineaceae bacterium]
MTTPTQRVAAVERYKRSLSRAQLADLFSLITGENTDLISYDIVARRLSARQQIDKGIQMVPLDQIVGSVGRYRDFTRSFLPRVGVSPERWARVDEALNSPEGFPPVELFKLGEVYFVRDGNHRVSVARVNGLTHIEAYVTEVKTDIPLTVNDFERDQWLIKAEYVEFEHKTQLNSLRPNNHVTFTEPGRYPLLVQHIEVHQYLRNLELSQGHHPQPLTWLEAVTSWYDTVYLPVVEAIQEQRLLDHFPNRTEADLYLWIAHNRERLAEHYGLAPMDVDTAVSTFAETHSERLWERTLKNLRSGLHELWSDERPLGMSAEEFHRLRERHEAGEFSVSEAEKKIMQVSV